VTRQAAALDAIAIEFDGLTGHDLALSRGDRRLFEHLHFKIEAGGLLVLLGPNGCGKSSLLRALIGLAPLQSGQLSGSRSGLPIEPDALRRATLFQGHASACKGELSAIENLALSARLDDALIDGAPKSLLSDALAVVGLSRQRDIEARRLSQGQRQRLHLARLALALRTQTRPLWLMDEPSAALDDAGTALLLQLLDAHLSRGGAAIVATHLPISTTGGPRSVLNLQDFAPKRHARPVQAMRAESACADGS